MSYNIYYKDKYVKIYFLKLYGESSRRRNFPLRDFFTQMTSKSKGKNKRGKQNAPPQNEEALLSTIIGEEVLRERTTANVSPEVNSGNGKTSAENIKRAGLSHICESILGEPLDKTEQCSVWDRRPLRSNQVNKAQLIGLRSLYHMLIDQIRCTWFAFILLYSCKNIFI